jgi:hypothetical protein
LSSSTTLRGGMRMPSRLCALGGIFRARNAGVPSPRDGGASIGPRRARSWRPGLNPAGSTRTSSTSSSSRAPLWYSAHASAASGSSNLRCTCACKRGLRGGRVLENVCVCVCVCVRARVCVCVRWWWWWSGRGWCWCGVWWVVEGVVVWVWQSAHLTRQSRTPLEFVCRCRSPCESRQCSQICEHVGGWVGGWVGAVSCGLHQPGAGGQGERAGTLGSIREP